METQNKSLSELQALSNEIHGKYDVDKSIVWMVEELGEFVQAIRKKKAKYEIEEELGDLLTWIFIIGNSMDLKIDNCITRSFKKEYERKKLQAAKIKDK